MDEWLEREDDSGYDAADLFEWCLEQVALILSDDPHYSEWLDYTQEQNSHDCNRSLH